MSNTANFRGNVAGDPVERNGFVEITIAHNPVGKAKERYVPIFLRATAKADSLWGKMMLESKKGERAYVEGQIQMREYEGKNGKGYSLEMPFVNSYEKASSSAPTVDEPAVTEDPFKL